MTKAVKTMFVLLMLLLSSQALADGVQGPWTVASVAARDIGYGVAFSESVGSCGGDGFYIDPSNPRAKDIYSMLLAAVLSTRKVRVWVADQCSGKMQLITASWISSSP